MSIPSRTEAAAIVRGLEYSPRLLNHSAAVAEVCAFLCDALAGRGVELDSDLAETGALLHDLDKALAPDDELRALGHGAAGAEWLRRHGHGELAPALTAHPVTMLGAAISYEDWAAPLRLEERLVAYADKRAVQDVVSLDERFERWHQRYPDSALLIAAHERARLLEAELCDLAGVRPESVNRLAWVEAALTKTAA